MENNQTYPLLGLKNKDECCRFEVDLSKGNIINWKSLVPNNNDATTSGISSQNSQEFKVNWPENQILARKKNYTE